MLINIYIYPNQPVPFEDIPFLNLCSGAFFQPPGVPMEGIHAGQGQTRKRTGGNGGVWANDPLPSKDEGVYINLPISWGLRPYSPAEVTRSQYAG